MGVLYSLILREEELYMKERSRSEGDVGFDQDEEIELVIPPVFNYCTRVLDPMEQKVARDLYWDAICSDDWKERDWAKSRYEEAKTEAEEGLKLLLEWGVSWDKRMTWETWVSWGRVLLDKANENERPHSEAGITTLGLVN
ncbi:hypothetical protein PR202_ga03462 [Eleusine coracana subsp. coracana]|uniref:Uncharacterized protein n=1 Tax=Eleusine coracana subsp. coracana TaxID=191504 RepID=A0AAV5BNK9_ELECO|nr:hypothetical protein PR202_ga03462 [Eleusine coracana subsp. coracana]